MTDKQTPPDWVLIEAAKRCGWGRDNPTDSELSYLYNNTPPFRALCDMIERYEQPPVDRKLLCARQADREICKPAEAYWEVIAIRAIELWEEGFGE